MKGSWGLETHTMFYIPNHDFYRTDSEDERKYGTDFAAKLYLALASTHLLSYQ
jgi:hypothetical protein